MHKIIAWATACLFATVSVGCAADLKPTIPSPPKPGRFTLSVKADGIDRTAQVHIPTGYKQDTKPPLVLLIHGGGGSGTDALEKDGWAAKADQDGFLVVAPEGLGTKPKLAANFKTNPAVWNSGQHPPRSPIAAIDDVAFIGKVLDELNEKVPYDDGRVFSTGHSNGGGMTFRLGAELSERFAAIAMVAGRLAVEKPKPKKPLPTLYLVGTKDPLMPLDGGEVKSPWGGSWTNRPVSEQLTQWAEAIGSEKEPKTVSDKDAVKKVEYAATGNGATLTVLYLDGHGHHWPGGKPSLPESMIGPIKSKLNATDTIWEFFKAIPPKEK